MNNSLAEKSVVVTGATSGIGYQVALDMARGGAFVILCGRDESRCERSCENIRHACSEARVEYLVADLASWQQVKRLASNALDLLGRKSGGRLDVLVNNAGLYSSSKRFTEDGIELTFAVNHLAPFLLTHLLLPALTNTLDARVLNMSSASHYRSFLDPLRSHQPGFYVGLFAYATSNLCRVLSSAEFNRRTPLPALHAWAIDPGLVTTDIGFKDKGKISNWIWRSRYQHGTSPEVPSRTFLHLATAPLGTVSTDLYWKDCQPKAPARAAGNTRLAARLWDQSCRLCGITDYFTT